MHFFANQKNVVSHPEKLNNLFELTFWHLCLGIPMKLDDKDVRTWEFNLVITYPEVSAEKKT